MASEYNLTILNDLTYRKYFTKGKQRKEKIIKFFMNNMARRTSTMFKWEGLPEKLTQRYLELLTQLKGVSGLIKQGEEYYIVRGSLGEKLNPEYMPTKYIVSNPYLEITSKSYDIYGSLRNKEYKPEDSVVIIPNDSLYLGLNEIFSFHSEILTEIQLTKRCVLVHERMPYAFVAGDNNAYQSVKDYLKDLDDGELSAIFDKNLLKETNILSSSNSSGRNVITQLLEAEQYQKAALFNDLGLQLNYNMKRETITSSEAQLGESALLPLCDDMLNMRKKACEQMNELFGLNVSVDFSSAWKDLRKSIETEMKVAEKELGEPSNKLDKEENTENEDKTEEGDNESTEKTD